MIKLTSKKALNIFLTLLIAALLALLLLYKFKHPSKIIFTYKSIWRPSEFVLNELLKCHSQPNHLHCIAKLMKENGASSQAILFTESLNGFGFMKSIKTYDKIAYAQTIEIAADHSSGYFLLNGYPEVIDINDYKFIGSDIWPADHGMPVVKSLRNGGQSFQFTYPIKVCHACKVTGHKKRTFLFDKYGNLKGILKK